MKDLNFVLPDGKPLKTPETNKPKQPIDANYRNPFTGEINETKLRMGTNLPVYDAKEQERLLGKVYPGLSYDKVNDMLAIGQSSSEALWRGVQNFVPQFLAGAINSFGATIDVQSGLNAMGITKGKIDNVFFRLGDKLVQNQKTIYKRNNAKEVDPTSIKWWADQIGQAGNVFGIGAESALETLLISFATDGLGTGAELANVADKVKNAGSLIKGIDIISKTKSARRFALTMAMFRRYTESMMEARQSQQEIYSTLKNNNVADDTAKILASKGAAKTFWSNMPLVALDAVSAMTMMVNPYTGAGEEIMEKLISKVPTVVGRFAVSTGITAMSEGSEEFIQNIIQDESMYTAELATGLTKKSYFSDRFNKELKKGANWNAFFAGAIGGVLMEGGSGQIRKIRERAYNKKLDNTYNTFNTALSGRRIELINEIRKNEEDGNYEKARDNRRLLNIQTALAGLHLDNTSGRTNTEKSAFNTNRQMLQSTLDGINDNDKELLDKLKITNESTKKLVKQDLETYLSDLDHIEKTYDELGKFVDRNSLETVTYYKFSKDLLDTKVKALKERHSKNIATLTDGDPEISQGLTENLKDASIDLLINAYKEQLDKVVKENSGTKTKEDEKVDLEGGKKKANEIVKSIENYKSHLKNLRALKRLKRQRKNSKKSEISDETKSKINDLIDNNPDITHNLIKDAIELTQSEISLESINKEYSKWVSPEHQVLMIKKLKEGIKNNQKIISSKKNPTEKVTPKPVKEQEIHNKGAAKVAQETGGTEEDEVATKETNQPNEPKATTTEDVINNASKINSIFDEQVDEFENAKAEDNKVETKNNVQTQTKNDTKITKLKGQQASKSNTKEQTKKQVKEEDPFAIFDNTNLSPLNENDIDEDVRLERKIILSKMIKTLRGEDDRIPTFEEFLTKLKEGKTAKQVKSYLNAYIQAWKDNDYPSANYQKVFDKVFDPFMALNDEFEEIGKNNETPINGLKDNKELSEENKSEDKNIQTQNKVHIEDGGAKTIVSDLKAFFYTVDKRHQLVHNTDINSSKCVDYDYMVPGKSFSIKIADDVDNVKVGIYDETLGKTVYKRFSEWGFAKNSQDYLNNIPLVAVDPDTGEQIFFVHNPSWYNKNNIGENNREAVIKEGKANSRLARNVFIDNIANGIEPQIEIKDIAGSAIETTTTDQKPLSQMSPESEISSYVKDTILFNGKKYNLTGDKNTVFEDEKIVFYHSKMKDAHNVEIRFLGYTYKDGVKYKLYGVYKLGQPRIVENGEIKNNFTDKDVVDTLKNAILAYATNNKQIASSVNKQLEDIHIDNLMGLLNYIKLFTFGNIYINDKVTDLDQKIQMAVDNKVINLMGNYKDPISFVIVNDTLLIVKVNDSKPEVIRITKNDPQLKQKLDDFFNENGNNIRIATTEKHIGTNYDNQIPIIHDDGTITSNRTLKQIMMDNFVSNIYSYNIGTESNPKYITRIQPIITYNLKGNKELKKIEPKSEEFNKEETKEAVKENVKTVEKKVNKDKDKENTVSKEVENKERNLPDSVTKLIQEASKTVNDTNINTTNEGSNVFIEEEDDILKNGEKSPNTLTEEQEEKIANQYTDIIKGLTSSEVLNVVKYIYNNTLQVVDKYIDETNEKISKDYIKEAIKMKFTDFFKDKLEKKENLIKNIDNTLKLYSDQLSVVEINNLNNLKEITQNILDKYKTIDNNWNKLTKMSLDEIYKKTGLVEKKIDNLNDYVEELKDSKDTFDTNETVEEENEDAEEEQIDGRTKVFGKSVLEENTKTKLPYIFRRFFSYIEKQDQHGNIVLDNLELPVYFDFDEVYDKLIEVLLDEQDIAPSYAIMVKKLKSKDLYWVNDILSRLDNASELVKTQFVVNFAKHFISMKKPTINISNDATHLQIFDANSNEVKKRMLQNWDNNLLISDIFNYNEGQFFVNNNNLEEVITGLLDFIPGKQNNKPIRIANDDYSKLRGLIGMKSIKIEDIDKVKSPLLSKILKFQAKLGNFDKTTYNFNINNKLQTNISFYKKDNKIFILNTNNKDLSKSANRVELGSLLKRIGITLSKETLDDLQEKGVKTYSNKKVESHLLPELLKTDGGINNPLGNMYNTLISLYGKKDGIAPTDIPITSTIMGSLAYKIAGIENIYSDNVVSTSINVGGKNIYLVTLPKLATDITNRLKQDENYRKSLGKLSYSSENLILNFLNNNDTFRENFKIHHITPVAITKLGTKAFGDYSLPRLSDIDKELVNMILLQDTKTKVFTEGYKGLQTRMFSMLFPTMSDKAQSLIIDLIGFNILENDLKFDNNDNLIGLSNKTLEVLFEQLVLPELKRIKNRIDTGDFINIKGYNNASYLFLLLPDMNKLLIDGKNIQEHMETKTMDEVLEKLKQPMLDKIEEMYIAKIKDKIREFGKNKFIVTENGETKLNHFDTKYKTLKKGNNKTMSNKRLAYIMASDYAINYSVGMANITQLYVTDLANYADDKYFKEENLIDNKPYKFKDENTFDEFTNKLFDNVSKRLAHLIAPGSKENEAQNNYHLRVFLKDNLSLTDTYPYLVELFYGKNEGNRAREIFDGIKILNDDLTLMENGKDPNISEDKREEIQEQIKILKDELKKYTKISDYLEVKNTDAQEYLTVYSIINTLKNHGKIDPKTYNSILSKVNKQKQLEREGKPLTEDVLLNEKELKIVLQPQKPIYANTMVDEKNDVNRMMYIKSAAIALIPQSTIGTNLNKLRLGLEKLEYKENMPVKASYDTANKVGSITNAIDIFNSNSDIRDLTTEELKNSSLVLQNEGNKIQQEAIYKAGKDKPNLVSLATQMLKLLFGDGVEDEDFQFEGKSIKGTELHKLYNDLFNNLVLLHKNTLFSEMGIDPTGDINAKVYARRIRKLILDEASRRGMQDADIKLLESKIVKINDKEIVKFSMPLWMLNNTEKYESLLISLVRNSLVKLKLPGYAYIASTKAGWKYDTEESLDNNTLNNIIYTDAYDFDKGLTDSYTEGNELKKAQIFIPSRFKRDDNTLVDLLNDKNEDGSPKYWEYDEKNRKILKKDMIDKELLSVTSFRIPTSSHGLMANVDIAGFLPEIQGDTIIVSNTMLVKKGMDFDFDKEFTYHYWHSIDNNTGKITKYKADESLYSLQKKLTIAEKRLKLFVSLYGKNKKELWNSIKENREAAQGNLKRRERKHNNFNYYNTLDFKRLDIEQRKSVIKQLNDEIEDYRTIIRKLSENKILGIHEAVLNANNPKIQRKVMKVLSLEYAKQEANYIDSIMSRNRKYHLGFLDDKYQSDTMKRGGASNISIGVYAINLTFSSLLQQSEGKYQISTDHVPTFGNYSFNGILGRFRTLDDHRSIAEVLDEAAQTAVDDMKENILSKVNINSFTINVHALLSLMGYDQDGGNSIPYMFLSQPILRDYVRLMNNTKATVSKIVTNKEDAVIEELKRLYPAPDYKPDKKTIGKNSFVMTTLVDNLLTPNNLLQRQILDSFLQLKKLTDGVSDINRLLNVSKNLKGNFVDVLEYKNLFDKVIDGDNPFKDLLGNIINIDDIDNETYLNKLKEGYIPISNKLILPDNPSVSMLVHSLQAVDTLYSDQYIQFNPNVKKSLNNFIENAGDVSDFTKTKLKKIYYKHLKNFIYADEKLGLFNNTPQKERQRLLIDTNTNMSLAKYLQSLKASKSDIFSNQLLKRMSFELKFDGNPSIIKFMNTNNDMLYETLLYKALNELITSNKPLASYNYNDENIETIENEKLFEMVDKGVNTLLLNTEALGLEPNKKYKFSHNGKDYKIVYYGPKTKDQLKKYNLSEADSIKHLYKIDSFYTTKDLAQDLINYNLLTNPNNSAIDFSKYVDIEYLRNTGILDKLNKLDDRTNSGEISSKIPNNQFKITDKVYTNSYEIQLYQNYPEYAYKIEKMKDIQDILNDMKNIKNYKVKPFLSMYDRSATTSKKFRLFIFTKGKYIEIPVLSSFGVYEFSQEHPILTSIKTVIPENKQVKKSTKVNTVETKLKTDIKKVTNPAQEIINSIDKNDIDSALRNIILGTKIPYFKEFVGLLYSNMNKVPNVKFYENLGAGGVYNKGSIYINNKLRDPKRAGELRNILIHEYIHAITTDSLNKYFSKINDKWQLTDLDNAPEHVRDLNDIYQKSLNVFENNPHYKTMLEKMDASRSGNKDIRLSKEEKSFYGLYNIKEFIANIFENPGFIQNLNQITYDGRKGGILVKFKDIILKILDSFGLYKKDSLARESAKRSLNYILNERIKTENSLAEDKIFENLNPKVKEVVNKLRQDSKDFEITNDEDYYVNKKTGKRYQRVTKYISDKKVEKNDLIESASTIGTKVDELVRDFFGNTLKTFESYNLTDNKQAFDDFINQLQELKGKIEARGEYIIPNDILVHNDELGIAGTLDLLSVDRKGNFRIYDMKTMRGNNFIDNGYGTKYDSEAVFEKTGELKPDGSPRYRVVRGQKQDSKRTKHTKQLSLYSILLNNTYGIRARTIGIIPIEVQYNPGDTSTTKLNLLKGVLLKQMEQVKSAKMKDEFENTNPQNEEIKQVVKTIKIGNTKEKETKLFNSNDKELKKGSVVEYKGEKYLFWNKSGESNAQLIKTDGTKFSGTPDINKLTVLGSYQTTKYNNIDYIVTDNNNVYSGATGKLVYTGNDNSSKTQKERIINAAKAEKGIKKNNYEKTLNVYWGGENKNLPENSPQRILSNLASREFTYEGRKYGSVEHAYQSNKSGKFDEDTYNKYLKNENFEPLEINSEEGKRILNDYLGKLNATELEKYITTFKTGVTSDFQEFERNLIKEKRANESKFNDEYNIFSLMREIYSSEEGTKIIDLNLDRLKAEGIPINLYNNLVLAKEDALKFRALEMKFSSKSHRKEIATEYLIALNNYSIHLKQALSYYKYSKYFEFKINSAKDLNTLLENLQKNTISVKNAYGKKIAPKISVVQMKKANSLDLMKNLVVESFKQNPNSEAAKILLQYSDFTHNTNETIDKAFIEGLKLAQKFLLNKNNNPEGEQIEKVIKTIKINTKPKAQLNRIDAVEVQKFAKNNPYTIISDMFGIKYVMIDNKFYNLENGIEATDEELNKKQAAVEVEQQRNEYGSNSSKDLGFTDDEDNKGNDLSNKCQ